MGNKSKLHRNTVLLSQRIRRDILSISYKGKGAHISSSLCIADILAVLYGSILRYSPSKPTSASRDRFILSKGHAAPALYVTLANVGIIPRKLLDTYLENGSLLGAHQEYGIPGVELATGSLGHGLSVGCGMALAAHISKTRARVFVLVSDAELNEGSTWEALQFASHHKLDNLVMIVDENGMQALGKTKNVLDIRPLAKKIASFGWSVVSINGHDHTALHKVLRRIPRKNGKPTAIIAKTIAGKGVGFMEGKLEWHYRNLDEKLYRRAMEAIQK